MQLARLDGINSCIALLQQHLDNKGCGTYTPAVFENPLTKIIVKK